jgi:hypothetical protein
MKGHEERIKEMKNAYKIFVGKQQGNKSLGRIDCK